MKALKHILGIILIGALSSCGSADESNKLEDDGKINVPELQNFEKTLGSAQIIFQEYEHDFGTVTKENKLKHTFYYVNSGDTPLVITKAKGSCGCTIPFFSEKPLNPGEQQKIDIVIDVTNKTPDKAFKVTVRVESNAKTQLVKLKLKGTPLAVK